MGNVYLQVEGVEDGRGGRGRTSGGRKAKMKDIVADVGEIELRKGKRWDRCRINDDALDVDKSLCGGHDVLKLVWCEGNA